MYVEYPVVSRWCNPSLVSYSYLVRVWAAPLRTCIWTGLRLWARLQFYCSLRGGCSVQLRHFISQTTNGHRRCEEERWLIHFPISSACFKRVQDVQFRDGFLNIVLHSGISEYHRLPQLYDLMMSTLWLVVQCCCSCMGFVCVKERELEENLGKFQGILVITVRLGELSNARGKAYVHAKHIIAFCSRNISHGPFRHKVLGNVLVFLYDVRQENI